MGRRAEWFERFFSGIYNEVLGGSYHEETAAKEAAVVRRVLGLRKGQRVLDIPCGLGRLTIALARRGIVMSGVDLTALYLRRARRRARAQGLDIRFIRCDMRDIDFDGQFDAAFNWFGSFGYFSPSDNLAFARRVFKALKPGGRFLIDGPNKSWLLRHFVPRRVDERSGVRIANNVRFDRRTSTVHDTWTMTKGRRRERHTIRMRMYNGTEIRELLEAAGFRGIKLYGRARIISPPGPLTRHSRRFIAVGVKPP